MKASVRLLKKYSAPKQLLRILLLALSPAEVAMASSPIPMDDVSAVASLTSPAWNFMDMKNASSLVSIMICRSSGDRLLQRSIVSLERRILQILQVLQENESKVDHSI
jgi:hypothetical protein